MEVTLTFKKSWNSVAKSFRSLPCAPYSECLFFTLSIALLSNSCAAADGSAQLYITFCVPLFCHISL